MQSFTMNNTENMAVRQMFNLIDFNSSMEQLNIDSIQSELYM